MALYATPPCTVFFEEIEWKALCCYFTGTPEPPKEPPTLRQAIVMLGMIGGHLGQPRRGRSHLPSLPEDLIRMLGILAVSEN